MLNTSERAALEATIRQLPWFHQIDFGNGLLTPGYIKAPKIRRMSRMLFEGIELQGRTLLDIGCWDGAYSVEATRRGATVTAADHHVWHDSWGDRRCIDLVREHLAPSMTIVDADLSELTPQRFGRFDVVLFLGVLYHLRHPLMALERVAQLAADTLIIETRMTMRYVRKPVMQFHPGKTMGSDPSNWWTPNRRCVEEMLRDLGFLRRFDQRGKLGRTGQWAGWCVYFPDLRKNELHTGVIMSAPGQAYLRAIATDGEWRSCYGSYRLLHGYLRWNVRRSSRSGLCFGDIVVAAGRRALRTLIDHHHVVAMVRYKVTQDASLSFTAHVTRVGGLIETQREFPTELDALDWVGERLGMDIPSRREA